MRKALSKRLRFAILNRDGFRCQYCGAAAPNVPLVVDHVNPVALGGGNHPENLRAACFVCNSGKAALPLRSPRWELWSDEDIDNASICWWISHRVNLHKDPEFSRVTVRLLHAGFQVIDLEKLHEIAMDRNPGAEFQVVWDAAVKLADDFLANFPGRK